MLTVVLGSIVAVVIVAVTESILDYKMDAVTKERDSLKAQLERSEPCDIRLMPSVGKMPSTDAWYIKTLVSGHDRRINQDRGYLYDEMLSRFNRGATYLLDEFFGEDK